METVREHGIETIFLRLGLATGFMSAVADRFGMWGPHGASKVAWGDMEHFLNYAAKLNPWFPSAVIPAIGWVATIAEIVLGILLIAGWQTRWAGLFSGWLLLSFGIGMAAGPGVKKALDAPVFAAAGGAFVLASARRYAWTIDDVMAKLR